MAGNSTVETSQGTSLLQASGCTVTVDTKSNVVKAFFNTKQTDKCCGEGVTSLTGAARSLVNLEMSVTNETVRISL